jgi:hypothetical protein
MVSQGIFVHIHFKQAFAPGCCQKLGRMHKTNAAAEPMGAIGLAGGNRLLSDGETVGCSAPFSNVGLNEVEPAQRRVYPVMPTQVLSAREWDA